MPKPAISAGMAQKSSDEYQTPRLAYFVRGHTRKGMEPQGSGRRGVLCWVTKKSLLVKINKNH